MPACRPGSPARVSRLSFVIRLKPGLTLIDEGLTASIYRVGDYKG
jgi:hypothetical protein